MRPALIIGLVVVLLLIVIVFWALAASPSQDSAPMASATVGAGPASVSVQASAAYPAGFSEGDVVRCPSDGAIYRLTGGQKRHYPDWPTYVRLGQPASRDVACAQLDAIPTGAPMS